MVYYKLKLNCFSVLYIQLILLTDCSNDVNTVKTLQYGQDVTDHSSHTFNYPAVSAAILINWLMIVFRLIFDTVTPGLRQRKSNDGWNR